MADALLKDFIVLAVWLSTYRRLSFKELMSSFCPLNDALVKVAF